MKGEKMQVRCPDCGRNAAALSPSRLAGHTDYRNSVRGEFPKCAQKTDPTAAIAAANFATANWAPLTFEWLGQFWVVTWGTFFIAATFFLRDTVQLKYGRRVAYYALAGALAVNVVLSFFYGDLIWVTVGSAAAFLVSETLDTEVFTRYHASIRKRVLLSGVLGGTIDSAVFAVVGLSPLTTGDRAVGVPVDEHCRSGGREVRRSGCGGGCHSVAAAGG